MKLNWHKLMAITLLAILITTGTAYAQSCAGEIVHFRETFGTGTGNAPLAAGRTNYNYNGSSHLTDGDYRLSNSSQARPEWQSSGDHTGNTNGRMMITNASYSPGEFYRDTVWVLPSNAFYSVYLYVMNLNKPTTCGVNAILPKLEFIVESYNAVTGTFSQIASFTSGYIARTENPAWVLTGGYFTLPTTVTAVRYRIINNSTGGCGNDLAIDDITFAQCNSLMLPIINFQFSARQHGSAVDLNWSTAQESNTDRFEIEKSEDGKTWSRAGTVRAAGNSNTTRNYSYKDVSPFPQTTYYRVLQVDLDGKYTYSSVQMVKAGSTGGNLQGYPNPFTGNVALQLGATKETTASIRITDLNGRIVRTMPWLLKPGNNTITLPAAALGSGIYIASAHAADGSLIAKTKLVKL